MADNIQQNLRLNTVRAIGNKFTDILTAVTIIIKVIVNNFTSTYGLSFASLSTMLLLHKLRVILVCINLWSQIFGLTLHHPVSDTDVVEQLLCLR